MDGYKWKDDQVLLQSLTRACRIQNDRVVNRQPIYYSLFEILMFETERIFIDGQYYLECLYKALFTLSYYGLMRVGEVTLSPHALRAKNVHIGQNKNKLLLVLFTSKTHGINNRPQKIKITAKDRQNTKKFHRNFCPFQTMRQYLVITGGYEEDDEQFFIFRDKSPVKPQHATVILKKGITAVGLNPALYSMHSFHFGRTSDLIKQNYPIDVVKRIGRWKSNSVFRYIRS